MPTSQNLNPARAFKFRADILGVPSLYFQEIVVPKISIDQINHAQNGMEIKTSGIRRIDDATLKYIKPLEDQENVLINWMEQANSSITGGSYLAQTYKKRVVINIMDPTGIVAQIKYILEGAWPKEQSWDGFKANESTSVMETLMLSVDNVLVF